MGIIGLGVLVKYDKDHEYEWTLKGIQREQDKEIFLSNPVNYDAGKRYASIDRRELLRRRSRGYLAVAKKLNADDIMLGK